ncbi:Uncharacterised protein [Halioglobus japonicus]|nr:Uncharacterised protein [Halioglobus japonicus]
MDSLFDQNLIPRLLFSLVAVALIFGPAKADFNATHATNPLWPPHARFHVVWQVLYNSSISVVALYLLWTPAVDYHMHIVVAAILNFIWGAAFYVTLASMSMFGGALADVNGIKPFHFKMGEKVYKIDTNLFFGTILMSINLAGFLLISG